MIPVTFSPAASELSAGEPEGAGGAAPNLNILWARVLFEALVSAGVRHVSLAPGSRSAPLAIAASSTAGLHTTVHVDERSAAFFALGAAKATGTPAAVLCTSGSAAGHFLPALIEAAEARVPLLAITADRPPEARGFSPPQTIDQVKMYAHVVRAAWDLPLPEPALLARLELLAADAVARATGAPVGPVQINVPLRDPLSPLEVDADAIATLETQHRARRAAIRGSVDDLSRRDVWPARGFVDEIGLEQAVNWLSEGRRPLIVAGPEAASGHLRNAVLEFARTWGIPILADAASGLRYGPERGATVCSHYVAFLRAAEFAETPPDRVVTLGMAPTSGTVVRYLARHRPPLLRLQADPLRRDPDGLAVLMLVGDVADACLRLAERAERTSADPAWRDAFASADEASALALADYGDPPVEIGALSAAFAALPADGMLFLASSMAIRYADSCLPPAEREARVLANRGANGIDGLTSTALGAAAATGRPLLLVVGDTAFLHDLGGLFAARHVTAPVVILVLNNDGGGIFHYLPIARFPDSCTPLCINPHGMQFEAAARLFGLSYQACRSGAEVARAAQDAFARAGVHVIEVPSDRHDTEARYRALLATMADAAAGRGQASTDRTATAIVSREDTL